MRETRPMHDPRRPRARAHRRLTGAAPALAALGALLWAHEARAQQSLDQGFADGFSLLTFEPAPAGDRFFSVSDGSAYGGDDRLRATLLGHYTLKPPLVRTDNMTGQESELVSEQLFVHLGASFAINETWLLGVDVPLAVAQDGEGAGAPEAPAFADPRLTVRAVLVGNEQSAFAFGPQLDFWVPLGSQDELTGDGSVRAEPKLAASGRAGAFIYAANVGYRFRKHLDTGSLEIGDTVTFGLGAGVLLFDDVLQLGAELYGGGLTESETGGNFESNTSPLEALFGAKVRLGDFQIGAGAGPGLSDAPGVAPRAVLGVSFAPRAKVEAKASLLDPTSDRDEDGIPDRRDACPDESGPPSDDPERTGCPVPAEAQGPDRDDDGVPDDRDACPDLRGVAADDPKRNGCPAVTDRDGDGIADADDACPDQKGAASPDRTKNGCLEDGDGDGVPDAMDACPKQPGIRSRDTKLNGCPGAGESRAVAKQAEITMTGFVPYEDGSAMVFVEMTAPVAVEVSQVERTVTYTLRGAKVVIRNNRNPLITRDFSSPVTSARLVPEKNATKLVIELREKSTPSHRMVSADGGAALEITFPAPKNAEK